MTERVRVAIFNLENLDDKLGQNPPPKHPPL